MGQQPETSSPVVLKTVQIASISLHAHRPVWTRLYVLPFALLYLAFAGAYFLGLIFEIRKLVLVGANIVGAHALTFLLTRWSIVARARVTCRAVQRLEDANRVFVRPLPERGRAEIVHIEKNGSPSPQDWIFRFNYQRYAVWTLSPPTFVPIAYPCDRAPSLQDPAKLRAWYGPNTLDIPAPQFSTLVAEYALAPFFVLQTVCAALWIADGYVGWPLCIMLTQVLSKYSQASLYVSNLNKLRALGCTPYAIEALRDGAWNWVQTDALCPGDVVSVTDGRVIPADMLLPFGSTITDVSKRGQGRSDVLPIAPPRTNGVHAANMLLASSNVLKCTPAAKSPDAKVRATVVRTGFGTWLGRGVRDELLRAERARDVPPAVPRSTTAFIAAFAVAMSAAFWGTAATAGRRLPLAVECALVFASAVAFRDDAATLVTPVLEYTKSIADAHKQHYMSILAHSARPCALARAWLWLHYAVIAALCALIAYLGARDDKYWEESDAVILAMRVLLLSFVAYSTGNARAAVRELDAAHADSQLAPARDVDAEDKRPGQEESDSTEKSSPSAEIPGVHGSGAGAGEGDDALDEKRV